MVHLVSQDLSIAGKRAGLDGERSGLFMEQIRIIKEMRNESIRRLRDAGADFDIRDIRPRYMVWENVAGAFSSNKGEDFRIVLEETARVADSNAVIPRLEGGHKWSHAGCILGEGWSIAWRLHDAQFWGVPQRRKRIALVADFGGQSAPEILFERKGLSGDIEQSGETRKEVAGTVGNSVEGTSYTLKVRGGREFDSYGKRAGKGALIQKEKSATLGVNQDQTLIQMGKCLNPWDVQSKHIQPENGVAESLYSGECRGGGGESYVMQEQPILLESNQNHATVQMNGVSTALPASMGEGGGYVPMVVSKQNWDGSQISPTLTANNANGGQRMPDKDNFNAVITYGVDKHNMAVNEEKTQTLIQGEKNKDVPVVIGIDGYNQVSTGDKAKTLNAIKSDSDHVPCVAYGLDRASFNQGKNAQFDFCVDEEVSPPIVSRGPGGGIENTVGALCARDYKGVGSQYVNEGKVIISKQD